MGAGVITRLAVVLALAASLFSGSARAQTSEGTHSPHGNLALPCQNCHTANGWKPIRAVPEFDHNQTRYPLRGMHASVACSSCHIKMVFTNVGQRCQDCHADIHKRQLGANCEQCHTVRGWQVAIKDVEQHNNRFPLTGAHAAVDCDACHKGGANSKFQTMSTACFSCHQSDFTGTTNPNHVSAKFSTSCETCHTTDNWLNAKLGSFDHSTTGFVLTGGHAVPPRQCEDCHANNNFTLGALPCYGCHQKDFASASAPVPHGGFPTTCEQCHDVVQWTDGKFDHSTTGFTLTGLHTVPPRQCADCHVNNNYTISTAACVSCHLKDFQGTTNPNHVTSNFSQTCDQCHNTSTWMDTTFNHNMTGFALSGMHTVPPRQCTDCHVNNNYTISTAACVSCHLTDFQGAANPNHVTASFPQTCEQCHDTNNWTDSTFNHSNTGFTLTGMHTVPPRQCTDCHTNNNYTLSQTACVSCHLSDFQATANPSHTSLNFSTTCENCHTTSAWSPLTAGFDHNSVGFPLTGMHTVPPRACADCHGTANGGNYTLSVNTCVSCHLKDFQGTTNPNHQSAGIATTCETCHNTGAWTPATFDHSNSGFPLTNAHAVPPLQCSSCHNAQFGNYNITSGACVNCHQTDYNNAVTPVNHVALGFPTTCANCHDTVTWTDGKFDHTTTGFLLTNAHSDPPLQCISCHNPQFGNYNIASGACANCHQTDYNNAVTPVNHVQAGFPVTCQNCHDTVQWTDGKFDHTTTGFLLTNAHADPPRQCIDCHNAQFGNYNIASGACVNCHQTDYNNATTPVNHVQAGFPTNCATCHDTVQWTDGKFDHSTTGFLLTNAHADPPLQCVSCHNAQFGNYNIASGACVNCHQTDYNNATTPVNHVQAGFPNTCDTCHDTIQWTDGKFDHSTTGFLLTNAHADPPLQCVSCHNAQFGNYNIASGACVNCHQTDYNNATTPVNHVQAGFPTTCATCHDTVQWTDGKFDHSTTGFLLTNAHADPPLQCVSCHNAQFGNYNIASGACVNCHQTDYNNATTPVAHAAAKFPTTCDTCHDTVQWTDGKFDHTTTGFPLTNSHTVPPRACTDCHVNSNYSLNSTLCYSCHQSNYTGTTNPAHASAGFPTTCETCHDTINWTDSTFNHNNTGFALVGMHTVPPRVCTDCHVNNNYNLTSNACSACHQSDYNQTTSPVAHATAANTTFFPIAQCGTCHSVSANDWTSGTFPHTNYTRFPTSHGNANGQCATCHINSGDFSVFQCTGCHGNNNASNFNHPNVNGYVYSSPACYQCHPSGNGG